MEDEKAEETEKVLSGEILQDARRRAERVVKRAEREGEKVLERARREAEGFRENLLSHADRRIARERRVFDAGLDLEERMLRLKAQGELLDEVFAEALKRLRQHHGFDYPSVLGNLAAEGILAMTGDAFVLRLRKDDLKTLKNTLPREVQTLVRERSGRKVSVTVTENAAPIEVGVVIESADGRQRFDNSFAGRLRRMQHELRFRLAELIFGTPEVPAGAPKDTRK